MQSQNESNKNLMGLCQPKSISLALLFLYGLHIALCCDRNITVIPTVNVLSIHCPSQHLSNCQTLQKFAMDTTNHDNILCFNLNFLPGEHLLESDLVIQNITGLTMHSKTSQTSIVCNSGSVKITLSNVDDVNINNLLFSSCEGIEVKSVKNVTIQYCKFEDQTPSLKYTILSLMSSNATIKTSSFFSDKIYSNITLHNNYSYGPKKYMIVSNTSNISVQGSIFTALWCGVLHSTDSTVNVTDTKMCNSTVVFLPGMHEHLALIMLVTSTFNLNNSTISNNTRRVILMAKTCNISIGRTNISENFGTFSVVVFAKTDTNITGGNTFSNNRGSFLIMNSFVKFCGENTFKNCTQTYNKNSEQHLQPEGTVTSIHSRIQVYNGTTSFIENHSQRSGGALHFSGSKLSVRGNLVVANNTADSGGGAYMSLTKFICRGNCTFANNKVKRRGGGIHAISSEIILQSESMWRNLPCKCTILKIVNNSAEDGGGVCLEMNSRISGLDDRDYTYNISFIKNTALQNGGAIFVDDGSYPGTCNSTSSTHFTTKSECFLQTFNTDYVRRRQAYRHITFINNSAQAGEILYGGLLDRCTVNIVSEVYINAHHIQPIDGLTYFINEGGLTLSRDRDRIASSAVRICFCRNDLEVNCSYEPYLHTQKGRDFTVAIVAVDHVNHTVGTIVRASLTDKRHILGEGQNAHIVSRNCTNITLSISSPDDSAELSLYDRNGLCKDLGFSKRRVVIHFDNCSCPIAFIPTTNTKKCECRCDPKLQPYVKVYDSVSFERKGYYWIGYDYVTQGYIIHENCPYDYCLPADSAVVNLNDSNGADSQCNFNRTGLLCGTCKAGLSLSPATSRCLRCPETWRRMLILKLIVALIFGIFLVVLILALDLTVAVGTMNGLIFYANIVQAHNPIFLPFEGQNFFTVFIRLLNTELSFDRCYFIGMDAYAKIWMKLLFPAYLITLVVIIIIGSKCSSKCATLLGKRNPVATLATLILLSYTFIFRTIIDIFMGAIVNYPNGSYQIVWRPDSSVKYFQGKHIPLFLLATILVLAGLVYTIILFTWQWLLRAPNTRLLSWVGNTKLNLFMDAYHAPYQPKYRFWTGLLLFVRIIINFQLEIDISKNHPYSLLNIGCLLTLLLLVKASLCDKLYKWKLLDFIESISYVNLLIFTLTNFYLLGNPTRQRVSAYVSVGVALLLFVSIVFYHIHCILMKWMWYKKLSIEIKHRVYTIKRRKYKKQTIDKDDFKAAFRTITPTSTEVGLMGTYSEDEENSKAEVVKSKRQFRLGIKSYTSVNLRESLLQQF